MNGLFSEISMLVIAFIEHLLGLVLSAFWGFWGAPR